MILPRYYCTNCKQFKTRKEVEKGVSPYWSFRKVMKCKWCHESVKKSEAALEEVMKDYYEWRDERRKRYEIKLFTEHSR